MVTIAHDQIRRDAEAAVADVENVGYTTNGSTVAYHCLALLTELEQAEEAVKTQGHANVRLAGQRDDAVKARDEQYATTEALEEKLEQAERLTKGDHEHLLGVVSDRAEWRTRAEAAEASLAKVPALVEALKEYADEQTWTETTPPESVNTAGYLSFEYEGTYEIPWQLAAKALAAWENE